MSSNAAEINRPLVVDLDGTLIKTDLLAETASNFLISNPHRFLSLPLWLLQGKTVLKARLAGSEQVEAASLPYNESLLSWLREEKASGRRLILATASHRVLADQVQAHLGLFDAVLASDDSVNLKAGAKCAALVKMFGERGFDYVGNDWPDMAVWKSAGQAHVVGGSPRLVAAARAQGNLGRAMDDGKPSTLAALLKAMRMHQWLKNLLIFVPLLAAHKYGDVRSILEALAAFVIFSLTASSVYLLNDLVDVVDDRHHARKRHRPFASGNLSLVFGWFAWPVMLVVAFAAASLAMPWQFTASLAIYFVATLAYSLRLKQVAMVDVITLAMLYTSRIIAGAGAVAVPLSFWLLSFSMFIFLSLALIKRYSELKSARQANKVGALRGRGYSDDDLELVANLGGAAGYIAVLVLALYIQDARTAALYGSPQFIWVACPLMLYWISRAWLIAHRGQMHDDPIVFALTDRVSWVVVALFMLAFTAAKVLV